MTGGWNSRLTFVTWSFVSIHLPGKICIAPPGLQRPRNTTIRNHTWDRTQRSSRIILPSWRASHSTQLCSKLMELNYSPIHRTRAFPSYLYFTPSNDFYFYRLYHAEYSTESNFFTPSSINFVVPRWFDSLKSNHQTIYATCGSFAIRMIGIDFSTLSDLRREVSRMLQSKYSLSFKYI